MASVGKFQGKNQSRAKRRQKPISLLPKHFDDFCDFEESILWSDEPKVF